MAATTAIPAVPPAHLQGTLTDQALVALDGICTKVEGGEELTEADAALVMATLGATVRELIQWRRKGDLVRDLMSDNVLMFPGAR